MERPATVGFSAIGEPALIELTIWTIEMAFASTGGCGENFKSILTPSSCDPSPTFVYEVVSHSPPRVCSAL
jgi:hypothetical protein